MKAPRVHVIGVPPGCRQLNAEALELVAEADLVVAAERFRPLIADFANEVMAVEHRISEAVDRVAADPKLRAVFLASGDPGFFGIAALLWRKLPPGDVRVLPAASAMQHAFARAGVPWSDARMASLHGRDIGDLAPVLGASKVGLFTDGENNPARIARFLSDAGWEDLEMVVCSDLGGPAEQVERGTAADFLHWRGSDLNVVLLLRRGPDPRPLGPGLPDSAFRHPRGRITKSIVRAAALGLLELPRAGVLWDVGAGSGSLGIEAALLAPELRVYAVERDPEALEDLRANRRGLRAASVTVVEGEAPAALAALPAPDRVFIGGSGGSLPAALDASFARLSAGGAVVVATVLAETFAAGIEWAKRTGRAAEWTEVSFSRSRPTGAGTRLAAENPVTLLKLREEEGK